MQCKNDTIPAHTKGEQFRECELCIEYLNICRLMVEPRTDSIASNQTVAVNYAEKLIPDMNLQEIFMYQKRFEALAGIMSLVYNERLIKDKIPNPKELEKINRDKKDSWTKAVEEQKNAQRPPKERKILSDREKAIKAYMAVGISELEATKIADDQMAAIGRVAK